MHDDFFNRFLPLSRRNFLGSTFIGSLLLALGIRDSLSEDLPRKEVSNSKKIKEDPPTNNLASAKFRIGEKVRILSNVFPIGHYRTPMYIRGKIGHIERVLSKFLNPEEEGYGKNDGVRIQLYGVRFKQIDVWPNYAGRSEDSLEIEIYEHWLEKA